MFKVFRDQSQALPGDPQQNLSKSPSMKIYLYPLKCDDNLLNMPKLEKNLLQVQPFMTIEKFKKYLSSKFETFCSDDIAIYYNNKEMQDHYSFNDIEKIYKIDIKEKIIIHYCKKQ